jgi:hypothetical protein
MASRQKQLSYLKSSDFPAVTSDYFPTVMDVLGYEVPASLRRPYDGMSLVPVMEERLP